VDRRPRKPIDAAEHPLGLQEDALQQQHGAGT
jgi:hypothetical protein